MSISAKLLAAVLARDKGKCAECGLDCRRIERKLRRMQDAVRRPGTVEGYDVLDVRINWLFQYRERLRKRGFDMGSKRARFAILAPVKRLWQVHHVQERVIGGDDSVANLLTLCRPCHARETADLNHAQARGKRMTPRCYSGKEK